MGYHHYLGKINSEEGEYDVRFTVQQIKTNPSKRKKEGFIPNQLHSTFVSDVEIYSTDNRVISGNSPATANDGAIKPDTKLETFFESCNIKKVAKTEPQQPKNATSVNSLLPSEDDKGFSTSVPNGESPYYKDRDTISLPNMQ